MAEHLLRENAMLARIMLIRNIVTGGANPNILLASTMLMSAAAMTGCAATAASPSAPGGLDFMRGEWIGGDESTQYIEIWAEPAGDAMPGWFRMTVDDAVKFYEFMLIEATSEGVQLRLHHFSPGLKRWEAEPITFDLIESDESSARFRERDETDDQNDLIYSRDGDSLTVILRPINAGDPQAGVEFRFERRD
jgi:hypothetical protein